MFNWLSKLLAGDQSSVPGDAIVERDEHGRVTSVQQTLSAAHPERPEYPSPEPSTALSAAMDASAAALVAKNIDAARAYGLGLEINFGFDQGTGELELLFEDGRKLIADGQIIGSFDPGARSFMWAWHNPSMQAHVTHAARQAMALGEASGDAALTEAVQTLKFEAITRLVGHAAMQAGCEGLYRAMTNGATSIFIGFTPKRFVDANGTEVSVEDFIGASFSEADRAAAEAMIRQHDADMLAADRAYHAASAAQDDHVELDPFMAMKDVAYKRDWHRDDDYWRPCSASWPSQNDHAEYRIHFVGPDGAGNLIVGHAADASGVRKLVYKVALIDEQPKIIDQLINWGEGFIWPNGSH